MKKVLGLALLTALFASPAFGGEVFVFNQWTIKHEREETEVNLDRTIISTRNEEYNSLSDQLYFDDKTIHQAASRLSGTFREDNTIRLWGTINTVKNSYNSIHETSAGIR
ncbi:hypothetical protein [Merismopedia glauca]|uniref:Uncharacterized protein n=1 Tax=Merismopedia glauca CCAP 1448/3 TaxID=1296344 RepID=A0A2T1C0C9_9CYAN|nr:hypothetical protein [Merismopedia glauca]PSB01726.1 hypothetical protein C7B64_16725 [Merismopedia glauca CCAP 1448/3]